MTVRGAWAAQARLPRPHLKAQREVAVEVAVHLVAAPPQHPVRPHVIIGAQEVHRSLDAAARLHSAGGTVQVQHRKHIAAFTLPRACTPHRSAASCPPTAVLFAPLSPLPHTPSPLS